MFVHNKNAVFREARRVLSKGGVLMINLWDSMNINHFARIAHDTVGSFFHSDPPGFYKIPCGFYELETIKNVLASNGFDQIKLAITPLGSTK